MGIHGLVGGHRDDGMITAENLNEFWKKLEGVPYVILRGFDDLLDDLNRGGDIDILVKDKNQFIRAVDAFPLGGIENTYNYYAKIGKTSVPVDLRIVCDGYYDSAWELDMLRTREKKGDFYVLDKEMYKYSVFYHCLFHKKEIPEKYVSFLKACQIYDGERLAEEVDSFMREKGYRYTVPKDKGVAFNWRMYLLHA